MIAKIIAFLLPITGQVADLFTTIWALESGFEEGNPLFGPTPDVWVLVLAKILLLCVIAFFCYRTNLLRQVNKTLLLASVSLIGFGAAGWNSWVIQAATQTLPQI